MRVNRVDAIDSRTSNSCLYVECDTYQTDSTFPDRDFIKQCIENLKRTDDFSNGEKGLRENVTKPRLYYTLLFLFCLIFNPY